ncbi:MAG: RDD family protein, partial [Acidobacteriota bacterium]
MQATSFDDDLIIETPEHVELTFALASVGNRFLASLIDHTFQALAIVILGIIMFSYEESLRSLIGSIGFTWLAAIVIVAFFLVYFGYFAFFETIWSGQTPGKRWLKLRVIRTDGRPISAFEAMGRNLMRSFDFLPGGYGIGVLSIILSKNSQRLGDMVVGTVVVKERSDEAPQLEEVLSVHEQEMRQQQATMLLHRFDPRRLTEQEWLVIETFLRRRQELPETVRRTTATQIT